jgi:hypothetical protein
MSEISLRDRLIFGIFGCGSARKASSDFGDDVRPAIAEKIGDPD